MGKCWKEILIIIPQDLDTNNVIHLVCVPLPLKLPAVGLLAWWKEFYKLALLGVILNRVKMWLGGKKGSFLLRPPPFSFFPALHTAFRLRVCALCMFDYPHDFERTTADSTCVPCPTPTSWLKARLLFGIVFVTHAHQIWHTHWDGGWRWIAFGMTGCNQRAFRVLRSLDSEIGKSRTVWVTFVGYVYIFMLRAAPGLLIRTVILGGSAFTGED